MRLLSKVKIHYVFLLLIIFVSFIFRLYKIDNPIADWHSWRQADTSSVSRTFQKNGYDLLHPRYDDLSSTASGIENPMGYRMVEFPFYNLLQGKISEFFPQKTLEWWGRMLSIIFSIGSIILIFLIAKKFLKIEIALLASFLYGILPYNVYYSRVILIEPMMMFSALSAIFFFIKWTEKEKFNLFYYLLAIIFSTLALLLKPFAIFMLLPLVYFVWNKWHFKLFISPSLYIFALVVATPLIFWRIWINQFPEGIPYYVWLFNHLNIRFKGAFFRWIFAERISRLILGFWGLPLLVLGFLEKPKVKGEFFLWLWLASMISYLCIVAAGNVRHDYYQIMIIPVLMIFLAKGIYYLFTNFSKILSIPILLICFLFMMAFSWYEVKGYYNINHPEIIIAGRAVDRLLPKTAKVIAPFIGDTAFLYQTNRQGWPQLTDSVDYLISRGATHYVSVNFDQTTKELMDKYKIIDKTDQYVIIDLISKK